MRPTRDQWAMNLAQVTAMRSTCCRRNVGCVLLDARGHVLATGYNGVAAGLPHCNESTELTYAELESGEHLKPDVVEENGYLVRYTNACPGAKAASGTNLDGCHAIHAEQNALLQCRDVWAVDTCYVTASPCITCVKLLLNTGCRRIVFSEEYPHQEAREIWESADREWKNIHEL